MNIEIDPRWARVLARDASAPFFYSVRTTGIFCRPACPSRRPKPEHVEFWDDASAAERAGFRACLRCRPVDAPLEARHVALIVAACAAIGAAEEPPSLGSLASAAGLSRFHFLRTFKRVTGTTPRAYALALRARRVRERLAHEPSVTDALHAAGYGSSSRFYERSRDELGMAPAAFRQRGRGERIRFAVLPCTLGLVLVAATEFGVCDVAFGDEAATLEAALRARFADATVIVRDEAFVSLARAVVACIDAGTTAAALPLDVRGTAFQERVWRALREIPASETLSYAQIAQRLGMPSAARAVARACARNHVAVLVPCHRAIGSDGSLRGYRWGLERKRALLARERAGD